MKCSSCSRDAVVKGQCKRCYQRVYMRTYEPKKGAPRKNANLSGTTYYQRNRKKVLAKKLAIRLKGFGLSAEEHRAMVKSQQGRCAICKNKPTKKMLSIDHCHATGRVRGLLCSDCNGGIGLLGDDPVRLESAKQYLLRFLR